MRILTATSRDALAVVPAIHLYLRKQVWCGAIPTISRREKEANFFYSQILLIMSQLQHVFPQPPFCTRPPQLNYLPRPPILPRFCRPLIRHLLYIVQPTITSITLWRITPAPPLCHPDYAHTPRKTTKKFQKVKNCGPYIPYGLFQTKGRCVQSLVHIGSEMWVCIRYKQTNKHTN
jgi:hypothetical protein